MADVICFPQHRNVGKARHVAELYSRHETDKAKRSYWKLVSERLAGSMYRAGLPSDEIERQIEHFRNAVSDELSRQDRHSHPNGAA